MYSPEHVAKVYIFVFVHNNSYHFYLIISIFIDLHQKKDIIMKPYYSLLTKRAIIYYN